MKSILFYDVETSGLSPSFDQVLTFACIRTDLDLKEISREEICIQLRPDIVPSPRAFLTHCLTPDILAQGVGEYSAALKIHQLFNTPGTISCGYNSLGFDDEFLRFLFYRNLLDPYAHQYAQGCSRMDMLPVTVIYRLFCDRVLNWPSLACGTGTLKLEHLTRENQFETSGNAHEAMADVEALLAMSRIFAREKKIWAYVQGFFDKSKEVQRILGLNDEISVQNRGFRLGLMVSASFGVKSNYIAPVLHLGTSSAYKNQSLWLRLDVEGLFDRTHKETDLYDFFVIRKRPGDQLLLLPGRDRFWAKVTPRAMAAYGENLKKIQETPDRFLAAIDYHIRYKYPRVPDLDSDAALYQDGFFTPAEKQDIAIFHSLAEQGNLNGDKDFATPRIQEMCQRIIFRNFQEKGQGAGVLASHLKGLIGGDLVVSGYKNDTKLTCAQAQNEMDSIESEGIGDFSPVQQKIFAWLKIYLSDLSASFTKTL